MKTLFAFTADFVLLFFGTLWLLSNHPPDVPIPERECFYGCP